MDRDGFLAFVAAHRWRTAKSSPHQYVIRHQCRDRAEFFAAVRYVREHGQPGQWNGETFVYHRPGDGYRYWDAAPNSGPEVVVAFNRAKESGQLRLWSE